MSHNTAGWFSSTAGRRGNGGVEIWGSDTGWTTALSTETGNTEQEAALRDVESGSDDTKLSFW